MAHANRNADFATHLDTNARHVAENSDLSALLSVAEVATQSLDIDKILNDTLDKSLEILGFDVGFIRILESDFMCVRAVRGLRSPEFLTGKAPVGAARSSVSGTVFATKDVYVSENIREDKIYRNRTMEREGVFSTAAAPVMSKNQVLGIIVVGSRRPYKFVDRQLNLLKAFGAQLGMAVEHARLYGDLEREKAYIENLVENAGDAIISTDLEDKVLTWNRGAEAIFGYSKEEARGQNLALLNLKPNSDELREIREKVRLTGVLRNLEVKRQQKQGTVIDVALAVSPIEGIDGEIGGFLHLAKDITEKNRYEKRLRELDRLKSDFVSNVSHELRTPLTSIKASVDNMLDGITGPLQEKQIRYLSRIKLSTDRLARLINDLLDLAKIEAGKVDVRPAYIDLLSLAQEVSDVLRNVAEEKGIELELRCHCPSVKVWADKDRTAQILTNLIGNALKFTPVDGKIVVEVQTIQTNGDDWVRVSVSDTGPGIPEAESQAVFDKFHQIARTDRAGNEGTGMGLAICKALVETHGGEIWLESRVGEGSTFRFTLPAHEPLRK